MDTLSGAVHAQANGTMDDYFPKTLLAKKIEVRRSCRGEGGGSQTCGQPRSLRGILVSLWPFQTLILEEASEQLTSNVRQQAMLCVATLRFLPLSPPLSPGVSNAENIGVGRKGKVWGLDVWAVGGRAL